MCLSHSLTLPILPQTHLLGSNTIMKMYDSALKRWLTQESTQLRKCEDLGSDPRHSCEEKKSK